MILKPLPENDIKFIDPVTLKVVCFYNHCYSKFEEVNEDHIWIGKNTQQKYKQYFHQCSECGRKLVTKDDKRKNITALNKVKKNVKPKRGEIS